MASHVQTVTRTVVTRRPTDIDPKVAGIAVIAALVVVLAAAVVVVLTLAGKPVDWSAIVPPVAVALISVLVGYLRHSSHDELVDELQAGATQAAHLVHELEPAVAAALPAIAPEAAEIEAGVDAIAAALDPATAGGPLPAGL